MKNLKLISPWLDFYREIVCLLRKDPDITRITLDEDTYVIKMYVNDQDKAEALGKILPNRKVFGNVECKLIIVPANLEEASHEEIFRKAFDKNPIVKDFIHTDGIFSADYLVFSPEVVQYANDDISDIDGKRSCLYEDIAKDVIGEDLGVFFCTEKVGDSEIVKTPLGEWP